MCGSLPTIDSARLRLRPFRADDAAAVTTLLDDPEVSKTLASIPYPYLRRYADAWIETHAALFSACHELHLAITLRDTDELLGAMALLVKDPEAPRELGYWLGRRHWGCGFATEAGRALIGFAQRELGVRTIRARCMVMNPASAAVIGKLGFRRIGRVAPIEKDDRTFDADEFVLDFATDAGAR